MLDCAHELKHVDLQWVESTGVANKDAVFTMLVGLAKQFEAYMHNEAIFSIY